MPEDRFVHRLREVMEREEWILSGNYAPTLPLRLRHCTDVIVLDSSWHAATLRYLRRIYRRARGRERHAAYDGWRKEPNWRFFVDKILLYARSYREFNAMIAAAPADVGVHYHDARTGALVSRPRGRSHPVPADREAGSHTENHNGTP